MSEHSLEFFVDAPGRLTRRDKRRIRDTQNVIAHMKKAGLFDLDTVSPEPAPEQPPTSLSEAATQLVLFDHLPESSPPEEL